MFTFVLLCAACVFVIAADFVPAPDLDAPKVYRKACIYCMNCTPNLCIDAAIYDNWYVVADTANSPMRTGCYRCQRTGKRMVFDSAGVVQWGKMIIVSQKINWADSTAMSRLWDLPDTTIIADTSGIRRIE